MESSPSSEALPVTVERTAELFGVTEKTVRSWIRSGLPVIKQGGKGRGNGAVLDLAVVVVWFLQENALDVAKTRLASAQADKHEMDNDLRRGDLADLNVIDQEWSDLVLAFRAKMLGLGTKLGPRLTNVSDTAVIASRINGEVQTALSELAGEADLDPEDRPSQHAPAKAESVAPDQATTTTHGKPVGGRKAKTKRRK